MAKKKVDRRNFFRSLTAAPVAEPMADNNDDPLFQKYSRKKLTPRHYSTNHEVLRIGTEDKEALRVGNVTSGLQPYSGTWTEWEVLHLLRRTNFGWKKTWVDVLLPLSPSAAVDAVLNINTTPPVPPVNFYQNIEADENNLPLGADWTNDFFATSRIVVHISIRRLINGLEIDRNKMVPEPNHFFTDRMIAI